MSDVTKGAIVVRSAEAGRLVGFAARGTAEERRQAIKDGLKASKDGQKITADIDRLRAAADRLDGNAGAPGISVKQMNTEAATAALLRTVADRDTPGKSEEWKVAQIINAAADLADTILGVGDE